MTRLVTLALVMLATPLVAQPPAGANPERLRQQIVERFIRNFSQQAGLEEAETVQFRQTVQRHFRERRQREVAEREILRAIEAQMRPGVAANTDSLGQLLEAFIVSGETAAAAMRAEQEEYAEFLTPVQRALLVTHWFRFQRQIEAIQRRSGAPRRGNPL